MNKKRRHGILTYLRWIFKTLDRKAKADEKMAEALERIANQGEGKLVSVPIPTPAVPERTPQEIAKEGVEIPGYDPWRWYPVLTPERILRAFSVGGLRDAMTWTSFAQVAQSEDSAYFESPVGFILLQNIKPGCSAEVHGGGFRGRRAVQASEIDPQTHLLLNKFYEMWDLQVLLSAFPQRNLQAEKWDSRFGFERTGLIPFADFWNGQPDNLILTARFKPMGGSQ